MKPLKKQIAHRIRTRRKKLQLKQDCLAKKMDVLPSAISRIESGTFYPSLKTLKTLCKILKCNSTDILGF